MKSEKNRKEDPNRRRKGEGEEAYIAAAPRCRLVGARARALAKGAAARPLDGSALTRWGARSPARGPAMAPSRLLASLVSLGLAAQLREKGEEK